MAQAISMVVEGVFEEFPTLKFAMIEGGLMGFEVWHPFHSAYDVARYLKLCTDRGLLTSSGSDTHAPNLPPRRLTGWPSRYSRELLDRCGVHVEDYSSF